MKHNKMILVGAWSMVAFSVLFIGITVLIDSLTPKQPLLFDLEAFSLFKVAAGTRGIQILMNIYAILPLLLIPAAVSTYYVFAQKFEANMRVGMYFATAGAVALTLSLMVLPSINWQLLSAIQTIPIQQKPVIIALLQGIHCYMGTYVGDTLGVGCVLVWVFITSIAIFKNGLLPRSIAITEMILASLMALLVILHYTILPSLTMSLSIQVTALLALWTFLCGMGFIGLRNKE